ncbi:MAG: NAD(P)/FAD-dependent oxidoreductase [Saprospiraceae bacterium]
MKDNQHYPVIIVGGGPAGLATALTLSARGVSYALIEAQATPIQKPGEAIPPNARPLLRQLGLENLMLAKEHHQYYGNKSCWGSEELVQEEFMKTLHQHGYLLDRKHFEGQLRNLAKTGLGTFYEAYRCRGISRKGDGFVLEINNGQTTQNLYADYLVDATGRKASLCRHLGIETNHLDQQFGLTMQVQLSTLVAQQIYIEATKRGWWYAAPMGKQKLSLMFFTLKELLPRKANQISFLKRQLKASPLMTNLVKDSTFDQAAIRLMPAGTSRLNKPYGHRWIAVGDAAYAYDPISSYGITSGLASGYYGAHALAATMRGDQEALSVYHYLMERAFQAYLQKLYVHYDQEKRWSGELYWQNRLGLKKRESSVAQEG